MANNKTHKADYSVKTSFGPCNMGFKQPSGPINTLAHRGSKLILTPLNHSGNSRWNKWVNYAIEQKDEGLMKDLEEVYRTHRPFFDM